MLVVTRLGGCTDDARYNHLRRITFAPALSAKEHDTSRMRVGTSRCLSVGLRLAASGTTKGRELMPRIRLGQAMAALPVGGIELTSTSNGAECALTLPRIASGNVRAGMSSHER